MNVDVCMHVFTIHLSIPQLKYMLKELQNIFRAKLTSNPSSLWTIVDPTVQEMETYFTRYDVKRLELYAQNMVDYHLIVDLLPSISRLFFLNQMDIQLSIVQSVSQLIDSQAILLTFMAYMANHFVVEILKY